MASLSDFNAPVEVPPLSDFFAGTIPNTPSGNPATINNIAAFAGAMANPQNMESTYLRVTNEFSSGGSSNTLNQLMAQWDSYDYQQNLSAVESIISSDDYSLEEKAAAVQTLSLTQGSPSVYKRMAELSLYADSEPDDNDEVEFTRVDTAAILDDVDVWNGWAQEQINIMNAAYDYNLGDQILEIIATMVPFYEQSTLAATAQAAANAEGESRGAAILQSLSLMGEGKAALRERILSMPLEERNRLAQQVISFVTNTFGPDSPHPNRMAAVGQLTAMLTSGGYSDEDRFIDNLVSVLDDTIILSPISRPLTRFITGAVSGVNEARVLAGITRRYERASQALAADEVTAGINQVFQEGSDVLSNALTSADKIAAQRTISEEVLQRINRVLDEDVSAELANDIRTIIDGRMNDIIPGSDFSQTTKVLLEDVKSLLNRRLVAQDTGAVNVTPSMAREEVRQLTWQPSAPSYINDVDNIVDQLPVEVSKRDLDQLRTLINEQIYNGSGFSIDDIIQNSRVTDLLTRSQVDDLRQSLGGLRTKINNDTVRMMGGNVDPEVAIFRSNNTRDMVRSGSQPVSLVNVYQRTNPNKARAVIQTITEDSTGRAAQTLAATNKNQALGDAILPEVGKIDGTVKPKVSIDDVSRPNPATDVIERVKETRGDIEWTPAEKEAQRAVAKDDWRDVVGLVPRTEMSTINDTPRGTSFDMVYGPRDGGFRNANHAREQAKFGLRKYGVVDEDIEVLVNGPTGYRPMTDADDWTKEGNYLVRVTKEANFNLNDTRHFEDLKSSWWKMFDVRTPFDKGFGGLLQNFIPSSSIVNKHIFNAASVASDRSAFISRRLLELAKDYATKYGRLSSRQKYLVDNYLREANERGLKLDPMLLEARGMEEQAIDAVRSWRRVWDTIYHFENADFNRSLRARGFQKFVDQSGNTDLIVRPLARNQIEGDAVRVWTTDDGGKAVTLTRKEVTQLYEEGGSIARTRSPIEIEDDVFDLVVVRNNSETSYTRALNDDDYTLSYRDGYYTVRYTDPYFITKRIVDKSGRTYTKSIATAETRVDAERLINRLKDTDEASEYSIQYSRELSSEEFDTLDWGSTVSGGRSTQRVRGQRLQDAGQTPTDLNHKHIESPEESLTRSILSIAHRTSHRQFIETAKARWMKQFGHLVETRKGQKLWPEDVNLIGRNSPSHTGLKDAVTTWRYIDSIENGYVDVLDNLSKSFFKGISNMAGRKGWTHIEKLANKADQLNINQFARRKAFRLLLASNPLRQVWVQSSQVLPVVASLNPTFLARLPGQMALMSYMRNGGDVSSFMKGIAENGTGLTLDEARTLVRHYQNSGIEDFVSAHTYMREHMSALVDRKLSQRVGRAVGTPLDITQKWGFELGENMLMSSIWLSEYDKLRRAGVSITQEVLDNLNAKVRHLTGNMNRAGDMPYNQNALSGLMQFFATPHKIFSQVFLGHNGLTASERARLGAGYLLTYGAGAGIVTTPILAMLPDDVESSVREVVEDGFVNILLNKTLSLLYGEEVDVAFTESFRIGVEQPNLFMLFNDLMELNIGSILSNSPAGSYVFGDNPKFMNFVQQLMKPFTVPQDEALNETLMIGRQFLEMFSGASNFFRAKYILEHGKMMNSSGAIIDSDVNSLEGLMRLAGFATMDEVEYYASQEIYYRNSNQPYDDVRNFVMETSRRLAMEGINNNEVEYWLRMFAEAQRVYGHDPFYNNIIMSEIRSRAEAGEDQIFRQALHLAGFMNENDFDEFLRNSNLPQDTLDGLRNMAQTIRETR